MTVLAVSMLLMAAAMVVMPGPARAWARVHRSSVRARGGEVPAQARASVAGPRPQHDAHGDLLALAAAWDLLAACLRAGLPVPVAVRAVAEGLDASAGLALRRTAELLTLGADAERAWQPALDCPSTARLARAARRSGRSGTALADSLARLAVAERAQVREQSETRAQRAGVLIAGPLGLCFLPAFLAIGVIPVVIGLATSLAQQW